MADMPHLLIVTPTLGESPHLGRSVEAVKNLGLNVLHVLSCPQSRVATLADRFPWCRVIPDEGRTGGMYGAINAALREEDNDWQWFTYINDDDQLAPGFGRMFRQFAKPDNACAIAYGDVRYVDASDNSLGLMPTERSSAYFIPLLQAGITPFTQQGTLVGAGVIRKNGLFESSFRLVADLDFWVKNMLAGITFHYFPIEVARFRIHAGQLSSNLGGMEDELVLVRKRLEQRPYGATARCLARLRYRILNAPRYVDRIKRLGWVSSHRMFSGDNIAH